MPENVAYNMDCMEYMRTLPDKSFDLAVVDPPYGSASQTVHVERELRGGSAGWEDKRRGRFGGWFEKYYIGPQNGGAHGRRSIRFTQGVSLKRIFGTGMWRHQKNILMNWQE